LVLRAGTATAAHRDVFFKLRDHRSCPLDGIDESVLLAWAREDPDVRFPRLAEVIRLWRKLDGTGGDDDATGDLVWTPIALKIIQEARDIERLCAVIIERMHPLGWSGSLADILQSRVPLLDQLRDNPNPVIGRAAHAAIGKLEQEIRDARSYEERERRSRDERFE